MADKVKGILLREEVFEALQALSDEQRGKLILALIAEAGGCDAPELDPITRMAYLCILPGVKRAQDESFRRHSANIENGKKGGRPRKQPVDNECAPQKPAGFEENDGIDENPPVFAETEMKTQKPAGFEENLNQSNPIQTNPNQEVNTPLTPHGGGAFGDAGGCLAAAQPDDGGKPRTQRKRFVPPTVEEVAAYCRERDNGIDPEAFVDFYTAKGWLVGKSPMKDWRSAVRTWEHDRRSQTRQTYQMPIN
ncbi:DUF6291 domain-containing protein [Desulfovibrio piger]|uniref:DUF6291 domain-containing protein n=1 Tax=Desulfovibrio piger TaxID=901 RepID=UPI0026ED2AEB|nr:DUF6291 domain-containing protein [Desulfovibrio piger]